VFVLIKSISGWLKPKILKHLFTGLFKVNLEFSFSIPDLFQTWNSNKPGFEKLISRSEPGFEKLNSRSEPGFEELNSRSGL
jgi:hypothetical protein